MYLISNCNFFLLVVTNKLSSVDRLYYMQLIKYITVPMNKRTLFNSVCYLYSTLFY